ncbi:MBOAT family protein [Puteibacter caeruleilacunae]|nr:MBOAT family protein [Puteibacter caeruleilacunae]
MNALSQHITSFFQYLPDTPFVFNSFMFWIFFSLVIGCYGFFYNRTVMRSAYLLGISLFFYYKASGLFLILLILSCILNYWFGIKIQRSAKRNARIWLAVSLIYNLGTLAYFKYAYFITDSINQLFNINLKVIDWLAVWQNALFDTHFNIDNIILPVGISFFTFQAISYVIDIYNKKLTAETNLLNFSFYLSFFPQLVAGPIVRASSFLPQIKEKYQLSKAEFGHATFLIIKGLLKKIIISDYISVNLVDRVFDTPLSYSGIENLLGIYGYSLQIYCDFSGYTDIAIGLALLMGFKLPINFNAPYKAINLSDFWRRWHISLSTWLRDYLYIPLGGNRKGSLRTNFNLLITMLLGGLWHGAHIRFIIWGAIHGIGLVVQKIFSKYIHIKHQAFSFGKYISIFITFNIVSISWVFFRADSMQKIREMLYQVTHYFSPQSIVDVFFAHQTSLWIILLGFITHWLPNPSKELLRGWYIRSPFWVKVSFGCLVAILLFQMSATDLQPFIYFRF